ncbi:hypothetical protein JCM11641_006869 [Rhodosporidiobolus odoratus]
MTYDRSFHDRDTSYTPESASERGHAVHPELVKNPSTLESLATSLKTWTPFDPTASLSPTSPIAHSPLSPRTDRSAEVTGWNGMGVGRENESWKEHREEQLPDAGERVSWARWDELPAEGAERARRVLILAYKNDGVAVWDCSDLDSWTEVLNLPTFDAALDSKLQRKFPRGAGTVCSATVLPSPLMPIGTPDPLSASRPLIAFATYDSSSSSSSSVSSTVFLYSLRTHRIVNTVSLLGIAHRILANRRFLIISTTAPAALHVYEASDLSPARVSPLTDVARSPFDGSPVFDLGQGGRLLAYATNRPVLSSRLDRSPGRPGSGILAHRGLFDAELQTGDAGDYRFATEAAHAGGEVARRAAEGVMSGVKAIGEVSMGYWSGVGSAGRRTSEGGSAAGFGEDWSRTFSKSAPQASGAGFSRRISISAMTKTGGDGPMSSTAGTVLVVDLLSPVASSSPSNKPRTSRPVSSPGGVASSSSSPLRVVAHFRPCSQPLALLSFSPSSTSLLTASATAHAFDVFELKPAVRIGVSATSSSPSSAPAPLGQVWHRYRLQRGYTSAQATSATWSTDGRFVSVATGKGTAHVYALNATGGLPQLETHFAEKVINAKELAPLSVGLGTVARVRAPQVRHEGDEVPAGETGRSKAVGALPPAVAFVHKSDSVLSAFAPPPSSHLRSSTASSSPNATTIQDLAVFHPHLGSATLHRLSLAEAGAPPLSTLATAAEGTLAAASRGDVGKLATTAVSGLSQLMKRGAGSVSQIQHQNQSRAGVDQQRPGEGARKREWTVKGEVLAGWKLAREKGWGEVREVVGEPIGSEGESSEEGVRSAMLGLRESTKGREQVIRYSAFAEVETFSRSPLVLPRSIYQSQQLDFFALPSDYAASTTKGNFALPLRRLEMRSEVQIRQGDGAVSSDIPASSSPTSGRYSLSRLAASHGTSSVFEPASFDQPIKTAMQTFLDSESMLSPGSPKLPAPTFPNGVPGKHGSWRDSIPILTAQARQVAPAALEGFGKVRQGLGRVRMPTVPSGVSGMMPLGRQRTAPAAPVTYSSSVSFEEDAVFAEQAGLDGPSSGGTGCTSDADDEVARKSGGLGAGDEEDWGWDDRIDDNLGEEKKPALSTVATPSSGALETPFEEDFDDFEMELPGFSPSTLPKPLALANPSPLTLDPVDDTCSSTSPSSIPAPSGLPRHLAPPVALYPTTADNGSGGSSLGSGYEIALGTSPPILDRPGSALSSIGILAPSTAEALSRSDSPASVSGSSRGSGNGGKKKKRR